MKDPQVPKDCLFDEGLRERLGLESEVFRCRQQEVGTQSKRLSARFHISYDIQEWPSGAEFRIAE
jgi:hypothetical protein